VAVVLVAACIIGNSLV
jgi:hypothetical protein